MYELLNIEVKDGKQLVSARELHDFLGISKYMTQWIKPYTYVDNEYGFDEGVDYQRIDVGVNPTNGLPIIDYALTVDMAKELCMLSKTEKGKMARRYFIQCEKLTKQLTMYYDEKLATITDRLDRTEKLIGIRSKTVFDYGQYIRNKMSIAKSNRDYQNVKMVLFAELGVSKWEDIDYSLEIIVRIDEVLEAMKLDRQMTLIG